MKMPIKDHSENSTTSKSIFDRAIKVLPGGVSRNTIYRAPHPYYASSAQGSYITDINGVERLDFANNMASLIHGHSHPDIIRSVTEQLHKGTAFTMGTEAEVAFAELLINRVPGFEKIRFVNSGSEAVMTMIKASRAFTGKSKIAKAEGAYHGTYDYAEISQTSNPGNWGSLDHPNSVPVVQGTPKGVLDDIVIYPFNDIERTLTLLDQHADQIACVVIDPIPHRIGLFPATDQFIEAIYHWTRKNNALMVFDEVVSFRANYGGAQQDYPYKPDLTALAKIIGGGFPVGAIVGKSEIMDVMDPRQTFLRHPHSGTFSANPVTSIAGRVAMTMFDEAAVQQLNNLTMKARNQIEESIKIADVPVSLTGKGSMFRLHFLETPPMFYREAFQSKQAKAIVDQLIDYLFHQEQIIMINTCSCMFATTLTQKEVDRLSEALLNGFKLIKPKLEQLN